MGTQSDVINPLVRRRAWTWCAVSVTGGRHVAQGLPSQDRVQVVPIGELLLIALADGAGSAVRGADGAEVAVEAAVKVATRLLIDGSPSEEEAVRVLRAAITAAKRAIRREAAYQGADRSAFATTLLLAICGPEFVAVAQVGDSCCAIQHADGLLELALPPQKGQWANETTMLTKELVRPKIRVIRSPVAAVFAFSDGLERISLMADLTPHTGFFLPLLDTVREQGSAAAAGLEHFFTSDRVRSRTDDDITLVIATAPDHE